MKALTLIRPWGWAVIHATKRLENRTWPLPRSMYGKQCAIHSGQGFDKPSAHDIREQLGLLALPSAASDYGVIGLVTFKGCVSDEDDAALVGIPDNEGSDWYFGPYGFVMEREVVKLATPVPCKGALGFWDLPADVERAVMAQVQP